MQLGQLSAGFGEGFEVGRQRDARQLAFEVIGELGAVARMMQDAVDVVEDIPFRDVALGFGEPSGVSRRVLRSAFAGVFRRGVGRGARGLTPFGSPVALCPVARAKLLCRLFSRIAVCSLG